MILSPLEHFAATISQETTIAALNQAQCMAKLVTKTAPASAREQKQPAIPADMSAANFCQIGSGAVQIGSDHCPSRFYLSLKHPIHSVSLVAFP